MDNQKDPSGTTPNQPNASRPSSPPTPAPVAGSASAASRKPASTPGASESPSTPNAQLQTTATAGANRQGEGQQTNAQESTLLDTALSSGKKWIEDSGVLNSVNQLPQSLKDLGNRAVDRINGLSTTQKVVGGAILAAGLGWLATRKGKSLSDSRDGSAYNYGRQRDAGNYGRRSYGYQAPDASTSRSDSGSAYGNGGSRFGSSGSHAASGRDDSGASFGGASARTDHGTQSSSTDYSAKSTDYRSIE